MDPTSPPSSRLVDAQGFLDRVIQQLRVLKSPQKETLLSVLEYLSDHIRMTRSEIGALRREGGNQQLFGNTADELEEIVTETARAANNIMDAAETIERVAGRVDPAANSALMDAVTKIYEASAFQDITGQRITKVVRMLQSLETKLASLMEAFGPVQEAAADPGPQGDQALLHGPQLKKNASSQSDIDALFETLG
jgi:chemotaxis protein CheZ